MASKYKDTLIPEGMPTQIAHKWQAVKRTVVVVIAALILINGIIALFLEVFGDEIADTPVAGILAGSSALIALVTVFLQRLMVMESLQDFLIKIGLGTGVEKEERLPEFNPEPGRQMPPTPPTLDD